MLCAVARGRHLGVAVTKEWDKTGRVSDSDFSGLSGKKGKKRPQRRSREW